MKIMLVFYSLLAFLLLITAAAAQLNDPDPVLWGGFYTCCALIPLLAVFGVNIRILYPLCVIYGIVVLVPTVDGFLEFMGSEESLLYGMSADKPYIEEAREFLGALIAIGLITISLIVRKWTIAHIPSKPGEM
jgi:hypothetical protein